MNKQILQEITNNWKLEARQENNLKYFFHTSESEKILNGNKFYVIGRKGSGKSAISEYILSKQNDKIFTEKLSFKNFPFNELYNLDNPKYTNPNQYISIWKYIIYSNICRLMVKNEKIDKDVRKVLERLYSSSPIKSLSKLIGKWTTNEFGLNILGFGGKLKIEKDLSKFGELPWIDKANLLEDIIDEYIDQSNYYIIFDELDEDYRDFESFEEQNQYKYLITSLFKAVQDIKIYFSDRRDIINPIVFLRDDIYSIIKDADKNKWTDFKIEIDWDKEKIKKMLAYRLSKSINPDSPILNFDKAWNTIFIDKPIFMGDKKQKPLHIFDYITLSSHLRPRDYIKYINVCCEQTISENWNKIHPKTVKKVDKGFSNYMKDEIIDEVHALLPEIDKIFSIISQIRKWNFSIKEFKDTYNIYLEKETIKESNIDFVLQTLFNFSIIGNRPKNREVSFFRYENKEARFNFNENIVVHRGLFKSLQIL
ncbi:hypothetical protein [uncultured Chryseobacterium sp.]|uniref:P-loop ATPase, Sll1717 family n=1 Tax=uncultured Chryseobacterium sp. TaxID=259322 RepID=UPI0025D58F3D|nr:hypothetical protein [uncultured Chryseobacterium sp.]